MCIRDSPITAHAAGVYYAASDVLDLPQFSLATPTSHVQASGTLSSDSALHFSVSTSSLADWLPFVAAVRGPALLPVVLNGRASFNGNLNGALPSPQLAGTLLVDDFEVNVPATANTPRVQSQWDSLSTSIQLSFHSVAFHSATLRRGGALAEFDASASLQNGHLTSESVFNVRANLHEVDIAALQAIAGYNYPCLLYTSRCV